MPHTLSPSTPNAQLAPKLEITASRQFTSWLAEQHLSLAFSTYQAGKLFFIGLQSNGSLSLFDRSLERCMGLCMAGNSLYLSTLYQFWQFENGLEPGPICQGYDVCYVPLWKPSFISKLAAENRWHLNGLALRDGWSRYVRAIAQSDWVARLFPLSRLRAPLRR